MARNCTIVRLDQSGEMSPFDSPESFSSIGQALNSLFGMSGPRAARPELSGALDHSLTEAVSRRLGVNQINIPSDYTLFKDSLVPGSITKHEKHWEAKTQLAYETPTAITLMRYPNARHEVHGFHTLPACYALAEEFLGKSAQDLKIIHHKVSTPITRDLTLVIYKDKRPPELTRRESHDLRVDLSDGQSQIYIRGYQTEQPVVAVIDSYSIPRCSLDKLAEERPSGSVKNFSIEMSGIDPAHQDILQKTCGLQSSVFFAAVHTIGRELLDNGIIEQQDRADYITRIGNLVLGSPTLFCNSTLTAAVSWDEGRTIDLGQKVYRKIKFELGYGADTASAVIELALIDRNLI